MRTHIIWQDKKIRKIAELKDKDHIQLILEIKVSDQWKYFASDFVVRDDMETLMKLFGIREALR